MEARKSPEPPDLPLRPDRTAIAVQQGEIFKTGDKFLALVVETNHNNRGIVNIKEILR